MESGCLLCLLMHYSLFCNNFVVISEVTTFNLRKGRWSPSD